mmetsp:Transcript_30395/g.87251  ORF Transcript_30395/g.87251 Transcript_30395/m.87251 type:complete len:255 (+) Transcript_30395:1146-1910(+)
MVEGVRDDPEPRVGSEGLEELHHNGDRVERHDKVETHVHVSQSGQLRHDRVKLRRAQAHHVQVQVAIGIQQAQQVFVPHRHTTASPDDNAGKPQHDADPVHDVPECPVVDELPTAHSQRCKHVFGLYEGQVQHHEHEQAVHDVDDRLGGSVRHDADSLRIDDRVNFPVVPEGNKDLHHGKHADKVIVCREADPHLVDAGVVPLLYNLQVSGSNLSGPKVIVRVLPQELLTRGRADQPHRLLLPGPRQPGELHVT